MAKIGDIVEIRTRKGFAYAHFTHKHPSYGSLLRVFNKTRESRPGNIASAVSGEPSFECFFPLGAAIRRGIVQIAGRTPVLEEAQIFPTFRTGLPDREGKIQEWRLWDGERSWRAGVLTPELRKLSLLGTVNDTLLVERIESDWTPESGAG